MVASVKAKAGTDTRQDTTMSLTAVGAYLRVMRADVPRSEVAYQCGTSESQIVRIEAGDLDTRYSLFFAVARYVGADLYDIDELLANEHATEQDGVALAHTALARPAETERANEGKAEVVNLLTRLADLIGRRNLPLDIALKIATSQQTDDPQESNQKSGQTRRRKRRSK